MFQVESSLLAEVSPRGSGFWVVWYSVTKGAWQVRLFLLACSWSLIAVRPVCAGITT